MAKPKTPVAKRVRSTGTTGRIANMRMKCGVQERAASLFYDRNGNPVPNAEVMREVEAGWKYFWSNRGGMARAPFVSRKHIVR